jgi:proteasome accessory factor B
MRSIRPYGKQKAILAGIRKALLLQQSIVLHYQKPEAAKPIAYPVDPYALLLYQNGLYLSGYSHRAKARRMFAVERIHKVVPTNERFDIPPGFSSEEMNRHAFGVIEETPQEVRIRFKKEAAYMFSQRQWHPTQTTKRLKNGDVILTMKAGGLKEISSWVLSWGPQAKVLSPPALVKLVTAELTAAARQYRRSR